jgi:hypothetical protein
MDRTPATEVVFDGSSEPYVKLEELARVLNVKPDTIGDWCRRYENCPHLLLPGSIRVRVSEVEAWLKALRVEQKEQK